MKWISVVVGLALLCGTPCTAFEIGSFAVQRGTDEAGVFDQLTATVLLQPGERVAVRYAIYREALPGETGPWLAAAFPRPRVGLGTLARTGGLPPDATLENDDPRLPLSRSAPVKCRASDFAPANERQWNVYFYGVTVTSTKPADAANPAQTRYTPAFSFSPSENHAAEAQRLQVAIQVPEDLVTINLGSLLLPKELPAAEQELDIEGLAALVAKLEAREKEKAARQALVDKALAMRVVRRPKQEQVELYFFTNRVTSSAFRPTQPWYRQFAFEAGRQDGYPSAKPHWGKTTVHAPKADRALGSLPTPGVIPWISSSDGFTIMDNVTFLQGGDFVNEIWAKDVLIYVHGFNVGFDEAVLRAAQLKIDLQWDGPVVVLDWPSRGLTAAYWEDRKLVENDTLCRQNVAQLLNALTVAGNGRTKETRGKRHLIAHSMGNEVLHQAVNSLHESGGLREAMFDEMIFAAPDVYIGDFTEMLQRLREHQSAKHLTLYYCRRDLAVNISRVVNLLSLSSVLSPQKLYEFACGRAGITPHNYEGVDIVNADAVNSTWCSIWGDLRHGYYASSDRVLDDIKYVVLYRLPADRRQATLSGTRDFGTNIKHYLISP